MTDTSGFGERTPGRPSPGSYEIRYGFTVRTVMMIVASAAFVAISILVPMPILYAIAGVGFFGLCGVALVIQAVSRGLAVRVDASGVAFGRRMLGRRPAPSAMAWPEIRRIVLFRQRLLYSSVPYLGVEPVTPSPQTTAGEIAGVLVPGVPAGAITHCRTLNGCRFDRDRFAAAVRAFAPQVEIVDLG